MIIRRERIQGVSHDVDDLGAQKGRNVDRSHDRDPEITIQGEGETGLVPIVVGIGVLMEEVEDREGPVALTTIIVKDTKVDVEMIEMLCCLDSVTY